MRVKSKQKQTELNLLNIYYLGLRLPQARTCELVTGRPSPVTEIIAVYTNTITASSDPSPWHQEYRHHCTWPYESNDCMTRCTPNSRCTTSTAIRKLYRWQQVFSRFFKWYRSICWFIQNLPVETRPYNSPIFALTALTSATVAGGSRLLRVRKPTSISSGKFCVCGIRPARYYTPDIMELQ